MNSMRFDQMKMTQKDVFLVTICPIQKPFYFEAQVYLTSDPIMTISENAKIIHEQIMQQERIVFKAFEGVFNLAKCEGETKTDIDVLDIAKQEIGTVDVQHVRDVESNLNEKILMASRILVIK